MSSTIFTNIKQLVNVREKTHVLRGEEMCHLPIIENAFLIIEDGIIADYGKMTDVESSLSSVNSEQSTILPSWCDSHTHLVFAGSRENEFVDRIKGLSYAEIAEKGGGILNSAKKLNETSEDELFNSSWERLEEISKLGTGAVEIKSGYGLSVEGELKILRVIKRLKERSSLLIRSTFLGAHAYPAEFKEDHKGYIDLIINHMLPVIAREKLADYIDVFCEKGFFSAEETETICKAGMNAGLKPKLHVNQLNSIGGIEMGLDLKAISLDHLEVLTKKEIDLLSKPLYPARKGGDNLPSATAVCTLLPTAAFFLGVDMPRARQLIDSGAAVAIASDFNPGSSPSGNMNLVNALAIIQMKMLPEEVINASTINGAYAMELGEQVGSITKGKKANLIFTKPIPSLAYLPYSFGSNLIDKVMVNGEFV